ncbi:MAG: UbiD family decarboxylase [Betaproteobacteria bacterium]|nr:UbiD family decarboxylase [Betaproteobacteria bacterium]
MDTPLPQTLDTRFRTALRRMRAAGRLKTVARKVSTDLEIAGIMKLHDGAQALLFTAIEGHDVPVLGNFLCCQANCEAAFGIDYRGIRQLVGRALANPLEPLPVERSPAYERTQTKGIDLGRALPVLRHAASDGGRFITAGIVVVRDPDTGVYNASYHRLQLLAPDRTAVKLDVGRHLRLAVERAARRGIALPIAVCIGVDLALYYTAATMGSQMPESASELAVAGGLRGEPLPVVKALTQDLLVPAEAEIVLEGVIRPEQIVREGPFGEFAGFSATEDDAPILEVSALAHRERPVYHAMNGYGRETIMLRKYVLEASLLKALKSAVPIVADVDMSAGGLHRFHATVSVRKTSPQHEGLQRNAMLAAFGALKDLDLVIVVDDDIDIRDPADVEYALATRMEASRDLVVVPGARSHEIARVSANGIRAKLGIDATVPVEEQERFRRMQFAPVAPLTAAEFSEGSGAPLDWLGEV